MARVAAKPRLVVGADAPEELEYVLVLVQGGVAQRVVDFANLEARLLHEEAVGKKKLNFSDRKPQYQGC